MLVSGSTRACSVSVPCSKMYIDLDNALMVCFDAIYNLGEHSIKLVIDFEIKICKAES